VGASGRGIPAPIGGLAPIGTPAPIGIPAPIGGAIRGPPFGGRRPTGSWQLAAGNWHQSEAEHQSAVPIHFSKVVAVVAVLDVEEDVVEGQNLETEEDLARLE
jgi:hypothetical protein